MRMFAGMIRERNPKARRAKKILQERNIPFLFSYLKSTNDQAKRVSFFRGDILVGIWVDDSLELGERLRRMRTFAGCIDTGTDRRGEGRARSK